MKPSDLPLLTSVGTPSIAPDGSRAVVAVSHPDLDADASVGQVWSVALDGTPARRITRGRRDTAPAFSPDGRLIAFLRADKGSPSQLMLVDAAGGEPQRLTDRDQGVDEFAWSPDGSSIAFISRVAEQGRYGTVEDIGASAEAPRRFTELRYRSNGLGYSRDRPSHAFVVAVPDVDAEPFVAATAGLDGTSASDLRDPAGEFPRAIQVTDGDVDFALPRYSHDGSTLALVAARHETREVDLRNQVWGVDPTRVGGELRLLSGALPNHSIASLLALRDGGWAVIAADLGTTGMDFVGTNGALHLLHGDAPAVRLTDPETTELVDGDSTLAEDADGSLLALIASRGTAMVGRVSIDGEVSLLSADAVEVVGFAATPGRVVATYGDADRFAEVGLISDERVKRLTDFGSALAAAGTLRARDLVVTGRNGYPVHGWVVSPDRQGPHPVLLVIHGGPYTAYSVRLFDEAQVYAAAGYAVVMCNPRGSSGYGQAHGRAIRQAMGTLDFDDVIDFLDGAIADDPNLDAERVGVMGGSYGGYLTAWAIAHDHRFAAAIVERGFLDPFAFVGTSDIGDFFGDEYVGTDAELISSQSPFAVVGQVRTPTLVIHSEQDLRCPLGQAETYFAALKRGGVEAELLIFPGENHELSRSGRPRHREQRFDAILDWWQRHLPVTASQ